MADAADKNPKGSLAKGNAPHEKDVIYNGTADEKIAAWLRAIADDSHGKTWMSDLVPLLRVHSVRPNDPRPAVSFTFTVQHEHCNNMGTMHGGCTSTLFDICTTLPVAFALRPGTWEMLGVTRTLNVSYMLPVFGGDEVLIECEILQIGKKLAALRGVMRRKGDGAIVATCEHGKLERPDADWHQAQNRVVPEWGGSLEYRQIDVRCTKNLDQVIHSIADENKGLHGLIAAAGIQQVTPAVDYTIEDARKMMDVNYTGVFMTATATARAMFKHKSRGSMCLIASMSGLVANKGLICPVYNSSKAAVIQLARNLAMEWSPNIRVNCLSPGHTLTPMVLKNFEEDPGLRDKWCSENMMGRLAETSEYKGAALFLLSNASSFMTGGNMVIDGGHTAW
ncbi:oxidoreductase protein [Purpureocillium lavendulum]|uniref:Oxidoreductase protein n=1 Tax=Purpureocillium lavendulum TaxID=1247861 RepID=A0AB34FK01_9HYPO|nr:oxidoreductase protein [Purpureocillium lavendulum]